MSNQKLQYEEFKGYKIGNYNTKIIRVLPSDKNKKLNIDNIKVILDKLIKDGHESKNISITCKAIDDSHANIKKYGDFQLKGFTDEDYIRNKVNDSSKFGLYEYADIMVRKLIKNK